MQKDFIDFRTKRRAKRILMIFLSRESFSHISHLFHLEGYAISVRSLLFKKKSESSDSYSEVTFSVSRKVKTFDALIDHLFNDPSCEKLYLLDYVEDDPR